MHTTIVRPAAPHSGRAARTARTGRVPRLWHFTAEYLLLLPAGAAVALAWANLWPDSYFQTTLRIEFLVNDVAMVLFFGLIMKEVAEATAPGGVLHPWRRAALPMVAAAGLTAFPLIVFLLVVPMFDEPRIRAGWPVVFATDLAFGYLVARILFGRHPAIPFFLLLAICANGLGLVALAVASPEAMRLPLFAVLMASALAVAYVLRRQRVHSFWPYVLFGGALSWGALYFGGFEPAFALMPIVPFLAHRQRDPGFFVDAAPSARDPLSRFELWTRHPAQIALLLFGLVNAGVPLRSLYWGALSLPVALFLAKPAGLLAGAGLARLLGLHLPHGMTWRDLLVVGCIASIGFTVALFFATAAVPTGPVLSAIKAGALASVGGAALAFAAAAVLRTGRFAR